MSIAGTITNSLKPKSRLALAALPILAVAFLAGCTYGNVKEVRTLEPQGNAFSDALSTEYRRLALYEADEMADWPDADHFAAKALDAARGDIRGPEHVGGWNVGDDKVTEINQARERLVAFLNAGAGDVLPQQSASAQVSFDCWIEQQEEGWQVDHIAQCRDTFYTAIEDIEPTIKPQATIFFQFDSDVMEEEEYEKLSAFAKYVNLFNIGAVVIDGHADRAGTTPYNHTLSRDRSLAVWRDLVRAGVSPDRIAISAQGEHAPAVQTVDGIKEPRNRRAEVELRLPPLYATMVPGSNLASISE